MKAVDITLFFQALNFFIVFYVLRRYIFYPAMHILNKVEQEQKALLASISQASEQKKNIENEKINKWVSIKQSLQEVIPDDKVDRADSEIQVKQIQLKEQDELSDEQSQKMKKSIRDTLMEVKS